MRNFYRQEIPKLSSLAYLYGLCMSQTVCFFFIIEEFSAVYKSKTFFDYEKTPYNFNQSNRNLHKFFKIKTLKR